MKTTEWSSTVRGEGRLGTPPPARTIYDEPLSGAEILCLPPERPLLPPSSKPMKPHDVVAFSDKVKRTLFGEMEVVEVLPNNRVNVRLAVASEETHKMVWSEYSNDLEVVKSA